MMQFAQNLTIVNWRMVAEESGDIFQVEGRKTQDVVVLLSHPPTIVLQHFSFIINLKINLYSFY